jgi:hypothetical protein
MKYVIGVLAITCIVLWSGLAIHRYLNPVRDSEWSYDIHGIDDEERATRKKMPQLDVEEPFAFEDPAGERLQRLANAFDPITLFTTPEPAITDVPILAADKAAETLGDSELVLGVTIGDESRAYPITMLSGPKREIINDQLGGSAIASTW